MNSTNCSWPSSNVFMDDGDQLQFEAGKIDNVRQSAQF